MRIAPTGVKSSTAALQAYHRLPRVPALMAQWNDVRLGRKWRPIQSIEGQKNL